MRDELTKMRREITDLQRVRHPPVPVPPPPASGGGGALPVFKGAAFFTEWDQSDASAQEFYNYGDAVTFVEDASLWPPWHFRVDTPGVYRLSARGVGRTTDADAIGRISVDAVDIQQFQGLVANFPAQIHWEGGLAVRGSVTGLVRLDVGDMVSATVDLISSPMIYTDVVLDGELLHPL